MKHILRKKVLKPYRLVLSLFLLLFVSPAIFAQISIRGKVTNTKGGGIPGVTVSVVGKTTAT
ncbi:MAG TPA: hypothetical protein PKY86_07090, partial [Niabella sp.]|nr:hypothetical protein [Niabella sp.]